MVIIDESDILHYGVLRRSGRYPWGSGGENSETTRHMDFLAWIDDLKRRLGWGDKEIAESVSDENHRVTANDIRQLRTRAKKQLKAEQIATAERLKYVKGMSNTAIGAQMGLNESSVRALLAPGAAERANVLNNISNMLKEEIDEKRFLDVGSGTENYLGISKERKDIALKMLMDEGYKSYYIDVPQLGTAGNETKLRVMCPPGTEYGELSRNRDKIRTVTQITDDGGRTFYGIHTPISVDPNRVKVVYNNEGGADTDGVIYLRPGVNDLDMGNARYAQVRIRVGDDRYIKGMAIYKDDLPDGVDIVFNTSKESTGNKMDALKKMERGPDGDIDPDNPFGSQIRRQIVRKNDDGSETLLSAINIVNEEGSWGGGVIDPKTGEMATGWSKTLASQVLSKQSTDLAKTQLNLTYEQRQKRFDEIKALTNPTVRKRLLEEFAESVDTSAVHLEAAALPRQRWQVILPIPGLSDNEVFAPNFNDGERVVLIRYPHGGTFEIPELTVNNRHAESVKVLGRNVADAIGINPRVAERLSGADFDGDTVLVIPNNNQRIRTSPALQELKGFDPKTQYRAYDGMRTVDGGVYNAATGEVEYKGRGPNPNGKQKAMGDVSNLITDMTIQNAPHSEIARAVRHSMVVIDSEKHHLDYLRSAQDNGIAALKKKYQGVHGTRGAATLISRATSPERVPERKPRRASEGGPVDPVTGKRVYTETGRTYVNKKGQVVPVTTKSRKLAEADDAHTLSSGTRMETLYADHSNKLKAMANEARLLALNTPRSTYSPSAAKAYPDEVRSLTASLDLAIRNRPRERQAQVLANAILRQKKDENPNMDEETTRKIKFQALEEARRRTGAHRQQIEISPREWEAIQAGAISDTKLSQILTRANMETVQALATPRPTVIMTPALTNRAKAMAAAGATRAEIEQQLGVSGSTLDRALAGIDE